MLQVGRYLDIDLHGAQEPVRDEPSRHDLEVERLDPALHAWLLRGTVAAREPAATPL